MQRTTQYLALGGLAACALSGTARAQFSVANGALPSGPGINSSTENVDFGDVDLDGDWDVALADGGDDGNDQNRLWLNNGGLQGGTIGTFVDVTATHLPQQQDDSRDIEFADIDNDGDLDLYISNTAQLSNQGNKWWVNDGGAQGGTLGFYTDETAARWIDLGVNGSSIPSNLVAAGTFIDWSCDCDFGDLDNDGDLDLVHSSYGGAFGGNVPTRIFLNDGDGRFEEFNPSGFQLTGSQISNGQPALWAEGTQQANTTDATGAFADVASSALDIDVGDTDGDFDLDILHGARQELPRFFENRLEENGGSLGFRDVTTAVFPAGWSTGDGHYEQELGDLDGDGDLDIYGLNWRAGGGFFGGFNDTTMLNDGTGNFPSFVELSNSSADDNEGDFFDYDNDGDLDLYVANFSGQDKLYRNNGAGGLTPVSLVSFGATSLDADAADVDKDGDYDVLVAEDNFQANTLLLNTTQIPDTHAPYIPNVENDGDRAAAAGTFAVRAQVYDNAPYYITWYNPTAVELEVDGFALPAVPAQSSQGQIFRAELPANLVGQVTYRFRSADEYGNTGTSADQNLASTTGLAWATAFGAGTAGASGTPNLSALSVAFAGDTLYLAADNLTPGATFLVVVTDAGLPAPLPLPGLANLNLAGSIVYQSSGLVSAAGHGVDAIPVPAGIPAGVSVFAQVFGIDGTGGNLLSSSNGLEVVTQ